MSSESLDPGAERFTGSTCSGTWFRPVPVVLYGPIPFCLSFSICPFLSVLFSLPLSVCPFQSVLLLPSCSAFSLPILFSVTPILCPISWCFLVIFKVANIQSIAYFLILQVKHFAMKTACFRLMLIFSDFPISLFTSKYRTTKRNRENAKW